MTKKTRKIVVNILQKKKIGNILELGSGYGSTFIFRKYARLNKGKCISLENNYEFYLHMLEKIPNDQFGKVVYAPMIYDSQGFRYDYVLQDKFSFALIDGPANLTSDEYQNLQFYLNESLGKGVATCRSGGGQSSSMLDYIMPSMEKFIIVVDGRKMSVKNYKLKHKNLKFTHRGLTTVIKNNEKN